jgi:hypothetical protein
MTLTDGAAMGSGASSRGRHKLGLTPHRHRISHTPPSWFITLRGRDNTTTPSTRQQTRTELRQELDSDTAATSGQSARSTASEHC